MHDVGEMYQNLSLRAIDGTWSIWYCDSFSFQWPQGFVETFVAR